MRRDADDNTAEVTRNLQSILTLTVQSRDDRLEEVLSVVLFEPERTLSRLEINARLTPHLIELPERFSDCLGPHLVKIS